MGRACMKKTVDILLMTDTKLPHTTSVPTPQVTPHHKFPHTTSVPTPQVSTHHKCPHTTSYPTPQVSTHHKFPHTTSFPRVCLCRFVTFLMFCCTQWCIRETFVCY